MAPKEDTNGVSPLFTPSENKLLISIFKNAGSFNIDTDWDAVMTEMGHKSTTVTKATWNRMRGKILKAGGKGTPGTGEKRKKQHLEDRLDSSPISDQRAKKAKVAGGLNDGSINNNHQVHGSTKQSPESKKKQPKTAFSKDETQEDDVDNKVKFETDPDSFPTTMDFYY